MLIEYDSVGRMTEKSYKWKTRRPSDKDDLTHGLCLTLNSHGAVSQIHYARDEAAVGIHYYWK